MLYLPDTTDKAAIIDEAYFQCTHQAFESCKFAQSGFHCKLFSRTNEIKDLQLDQPRGAA